MRAESTGRLLNLTQQNLAILREKEPSVAFDAASGMPVYGNLTAGPYPSAVVVPAKDKEASISTLTDELSARNIQNQSPIA